MDNNYIENTLVLGNGFSRTVFEGIPSWGNLFDEEKSAINNYTILYEVYLLNSDLEEGDIKHKIVDRISNQFSKENIKKSICDLDNFGKYLMENKVYNIITTNYDKGIEVILCDFCGYKEVTPEELVAEKIYSIRTYRKFINSKTGHEVKLWKIHGDMERIESITLGFDQYCGALSKLSSYIKGKYKSEKGPECNISMIDKCKMKEFDNLSWAELFFNTNMYIVGLGMDFSEIDIWWLLNKHMRIKNIVPQIENKICYLYNEQYDNKAKKSDIFEALDSFQVKCIGIKSDKNYIQTIFEEMKKI